MDREAQRAGRGRAFSRAAAESIVWLGGENESFGDEKEKLGQWLKFFGLEDVPVHVHTLPFEDPYINAAPDPAASRPSSSCRPTCAAGKKMIVLSTLAALCHPP